MRRNFFVFALLASISTSAAAQTAAEVKAYCAEQGEELRATVLNPQFREALEAEVNFVKDSVQAVLAEQSARFSSEIKTELSGGLETPFKLELRGELESLNLRAAEDLAKIIIGDTSSCKATPQHFLDTQLYTASCGVENLSERPVYARPTAIGDGWISGVDAELYSYHRSLSLCAVRSIPREFGDGFKINYTVKICDDVSYAVGGKKRGHMNAIYASVAESKLGPAGLLQSAVADFTRQGGIDVRERLIDSLPAFEHFCLNRKAEQIRKEIIGGSAR